MAYEPTDAMKEEAQRGLDWRREFGRGGTDVGIARARDIVNGKNLSLDTVKRMRSFFARHEVDKQAEGFRPGEDGYPSNGRIAWALWGGDAGRNWAEGIIDQMDEENRAASERPYANEHAARIRDPRQYDSFRRRNNGGGQGVDFIFGIKDGNSEIQAIRFRTQFFTVAEAKAWLKRNNFEPIQFEPATEDARSMQDGGEFDMIAREMEDGALEIQMSITTDAENASNRDKVVQNWNLGPEAASVDPEANTEYWQKMATIWDVTEDVARRRLCANCEYFDNSESTQAQMEQISLDKFDLDGGGRGYCHKFEFICHNLRVCQEWEEKEYESSDEEVRYSRDKIETRAMSMDDQVIDADARRVKIAVSSEEPVERSFGIEILDHKPGSIDLSFLNSGRAPLLLDHDPTKQIGVVESVALDGSARRLRATVRFGRNGLAKEVFDDVTDGIRANISVGYQINKLDKEGKETYRATSWMPMEVSIVSIPADRTVGVGRAAADDLTTTIPATPIMEAKMAEVDLDAVKAEAARAAAKEAAEMIRLGSAHNKRDLAEKAIASGRSLAEFRGELLEAIGNKPLDTADVGMTQKEVRKFSLMNAIRAMANPTDYRAQEEARFEFEASAAAQRAMGLEARGLMIPGDVLRQWAKRDLNTSDDSGLIAQDFRGGDFIDVLRNASSVMQAGATMLTGLKGNVAIPKKTAGSSAGWISTEGGAASESEPTFGQVTMTPKTLGAFTDITRLMMMQSSPDIEALVRDDLSRAIALAIDLGGLQGSGSSGQPTGVKNTSGVNKPTSFAAANPTFAEVVALETAVAEDNALLGSLAYILPASMYGALKTTKKDAGSGEFVVEPTGNINGQRAIVSNQVTSGDLFFGNFADLLIGMYGGLDILVDPYTSSSSGTVRIRALQTVDVAVRNAVSFAYNNDGV